MLFKPDIVKCVLLALDEILFEKLSINYNFDGTFKQILHIRKASNMKEAKAIMSLLGICLSL